MNIYERIINTWKPFLPLKTGGFCTTGECAQWANDNIRQVYPGVPIGGHAWTRFMYGNDNGGLSGYSDMPDNYLPEDNRRNFIASQRLSKKLNELGPDEFLDKKMLYLINMYYQGTRRKTAKQAYREGYRSDKLGKITGTHTGNLYWDADKGEWRVNHNMSTHVVDEPLQDLIAPNPKTKQYGLYGHVPTAIVPLTSSVDNTVVVDDFADNSVAAGYNNSGNHEKTHPRFPVFLDQEQILEYINNPKLMYEDYPQGLVGDPKSQELLNSLHIYPTSDLNYANMTSPLVMSGLQSAMNESDKLISQYGITQTEFDQFMPLVMGILWKESNGGSKEYKHRNGNLVDNSEYSKKHLNKFWFGSRSSAGYMQPFLDISSTMGSVKLNDKIPLVYGEGLVDNPLEVTNWNDHLYRDVTYSGPNVMSNLINNYIKLQQMLGDKSNILFNERGGLSQVAKGLLLEAHNQGIDGNISKSVENYLKDGNIDHLGQYGTPELYYTDSPENRPEYAPAILYNLNRGFYETDEQMLPEITVEFNPNTGSTTKSTGYRNEQGDFVFESQTNYPTFNQYSNYQNLQPRRQNRSRQQQSSSGKRVKVRRIER